MSTLYILIPWLLALYRFCFYREDKREFYTKGGIDVSETFLVIYARYKCLIKKNSLSVSPSYACVEINWHTDITQVFRIQAFTCQMSLS